jgi:cytochrome c553
MRLRDAPLAGLLLLVLAGMQGAGAADAPPAGATAKPAQDEAAGATFFRTHIQPILADSCWRCHGSAKQRAGLRLDSRAGVLHGGHSAIVVPGDPDKSRLMAALSYEDDDLQMPPDGKLTDQQIADIATWIRLGVPWAAETTQPKAASPEGHPSTPHP